MLLVAAVPLALAIATAAMISPAHARHSSHEDNKLNYKDCEGRNLTIRWDTSNNVLLASLPGTAAGPGGSEIKYAAWDGSCRTLAWDIDSRQFVHTFDGGRETSLIINYVTWDGSKWSAMRQGAGFYHVFVAAEDERQPASRVKDAIEWLENNKADNQTARNMVRLLNSTSSR